MVDVIPSSRRRSRMRLAAALALAALVVSACSSGERLDERASDQSPSTTTPTTTATAATPGSVGPATTVTTLAPGANPSATAALTPAVAAGSFPSPACRDTSRGRFVSVAGDDASPGTLDRPFRTVAKGVAQMRHGDVLFIRAGTYANRGPDGVTDGLVSLLRRGTGAADRWITICGYPGERPVLHANESESGAVLIEATTYVHVEGLALKGTVQGDAKPARGQDAKGVWVGRHPNKDSEASHVRIWNNDIYDFGSSAVATNLSNNIDVRGNRIWNTSRWSPWAASGISIHWPNRGSGNDAGGYANYIVGNLLWDNLMDDRLYDPKSPFGLTDGNCIIIDENAHYTDEGRGRTLIKGNVCVANGGPGVAITRSKNVDVIANTFYRNNVTTLPTVANHGEIMCNAMTSRATIEGRSVQTICEGIAMKDNVVVTRPDRKEVMALFGPNTITFGGNVFVRNGFQPKRGDTVVADGTKVIARPNEDDPVTGDWTTVGPAAGKGAPWPLVVS
jgi:hypothetical protein